MVLELDLEVEERIFVVNLDDPAGGLARIDPYALLDTQHIEGVDLSLRMSDDRTRPISIQQIIDPDMLAPDHLLEMPISQLADNLKEQHELISQRKPCSLSGLLKGSKEYLRSLFCIFDEKNIIPACSFQQIPHLILLEFESKQLLECSLTESPII